MIGHCLSCQKRQQKRDAIGCATKLVRLIMCPQLRTSVFWFQIKCCCCCTPVNDAAFNLLTVAYNEMTVMACTLTTDTYSREENLDQMDYMNKLEIFLEQYFCPAMITYLRTIYICKH